MSRKFLCPCKPLFLVKGTGQKFINREQLSNHFYNPSPEGNKQAARIGGPTGGMIEFVHSVRWRCRALMATTQTAACTESNWSFGTTCRCSVRDS